MAVNISSLVDPLNGISCVIKKYVITPTDHMSHSLPYRRRMISGAMERTEPANAVRGALPGLCIVATPKSIILMGELISSPENIICSAYICECEGNKNQFNSIQLLHHI
jgi:hypothetical protein